MTGAHRVIPYPGGKYAYLSTSYPGFAGNIMVVLDVSDPLHPKDVGKWWQPGQKDGEPKSPFPEGFHGPVNVSPDGKWATLPYTPDLVNLDLTDPTNPEADRARFPSRRRSRASASSRSTPCCRCGTASSPM